MYVSLRNDIDELIAMLVSIINSMKKKLNN